MMQRDCRHGISYMDIAVSAVTVTTHIAYWDTARESHFKFMEKPCNVLHVVDVQKHKNNIIYNFKCRQSLTERGKGCNNRKLGVRPGTLPPVV